MQVCTRCVLPETFPGIHFDEEGVCNHCRKFESFAATSDQKIEYQNKLQALVNDTNGKVLMAYSGGKDSTYTMWLLKEKYGADVTAFTFDNGFISPQATTNIENVCNLLDIPHVTISHEQEVMDTLFRHAAGNDMYPMKSMERASTICTMCSGFFKSIAMAYALQNDVAMIGYGWSPGQAPIQSALTKANPLFVKSAQKQASEAVIKVIGDDGMKYFLQDHHYEIPADKWPHSVHPLAFEPYDEEAIKEKIRSLGWVDPTDVDTNSTNCTMNAFANQVHIDRYGFHPYAMEIANMVRQGTMSRDEGMEKIYADQNQVLVDFARKEIGL